MHCAVQSTLVDLGAKACQETFLNLVGWKSQRLNLEICKDFGICNDGFSSCF